MSATPTATCQHSEHEKWRLGIYPALSSLTSTFFHPFWQRPVITGRRNKITLVVMKGWKEREGSNVLSAFSHFIKTARASGLKLEMLSSAIKNNFCSYLMQIVKTKIIHHTFSRLNVKYLGDFLTPIVFIKKFNLLKWGAQCHFLT